jgi:hypothetical protein
MLAEQVSGLAWGPQETHLFFLVLSSTLAPLSLGLLVGFLIRRSPLTCSLVFLGSGLIGLLGAHIHFLLAHPNLRSGGPILGVHTPGGVLAVAAYLAILTIALPKVSWVADAAAPTLGPGIAISRITCFAYGCCSEVRIYYLVLAGLVCTYALAKRQRVSASGGLLLQTVALYLAGSSIIELSLRSHWGLGLALVSATGAVACLGAAVWSGRRLASSGVATDMDPLAFTGMLKEVQTETRQRS